MKKVLIADDERITLCVLKEEFIRAGYDVTAVGDGEAAFALVKSNHFDLALLDMQMPHKTGLEIVKEIRNKAQDTIVIMITAYSSVENAVESMKLGANDYITKPYDIDDVLKKVKKLFEAFGSPSLPVVKEDEMVDLCGDNIYMLQIKDTIRKIRDLPTTVLLTGESGTGKTMVAKEIHRTSLRADAPFVHVNCAAIPPNLIESELFGHEKGAFTGATAVHQGKFEQAGKGTIFLDEIGLMPLNLQAKLLNVLQERSIERIGGSSSIRVEARVIAATNINLERCMEEGRFRSDLFYRLNVVQIEIPPLRYRKNDIVSIAKLFISRFEQMQGKKINYIGNDFWQALFQYNWPGNVRELENVIESSMALCDSGKLTFASLPMRVTQEQPEHLKPVASQNYKTMLEQQECATILAALEKFDGHREKTAQYLGISKRTLQYKLKNLNLLN